MLNALPMRFATTGEIPTSKRPCRWTKLQREVLSGVGSLAAVKASVLDRGDGVSDPDDRLAGRRIQPRIDCQAVKMIESRPICPLGKRCLAPLGKLTRETTGDRSVARI